MLETWPFFGGTLIGGTTYAIGAMVTGNELTLPRAENLVHMGKAEWTLE
jgi:hypothetical protein